MIPEERAQALEAKIRALVRLAHEIAEARGADADPSRYDLTPEEALGASELMMPAVSWPRRWLADAFAAAVADERVRCATLVQQWKGPPSKTGMIRALVDPGSYADTDEQAGYDPVLERQAAAVDAMAAEMKTRLLENRAKGEWTGADPGALFIRLARELGELAEALLIPVGPFQGEADLRARVRHEAADVGNFALMIADVVAGWREPTGEGNG